MSEKYSIGDFVVYDIYGICIVNKIENLSLISGTPKRKYYILSPINSPASTYYVPVSGEAVNKLRLPMTETEIQQLLLKAKSSSPAWIEKRQERNEYANRILSMGITPDLISLIGCLYNRKKLLENQGKRLCATDENTFSLAEKILREEFAFSLNIPADKVSEYIHTFMESIT
jgi:RNA polymerase-interacting CarD/CdnL/TRCF family regulator